MHGCQVPHALQHIDRQTNKWLLIFLHTFFKIDSCHLSFIHFFKDPRLLLIHYVIYFSSLCQKSCTNPAVPAFAIIFVLYNLTKTWLIPWENMAPGSWTRSNLDVHMRIYTYWRKNTNAFTVKKINIESFWCLYEHPYRRKPYQCSYREKSISIKNYIDIYMRTYAEEKPYHCTHSEKAFLISSALINHIRTYTGVGPIRSYLHIHIRTRYWRETISMHPMWQNIFTKG